MSLVSDRINSIINKFSFNNYLEIGINKGETFFNISISNKFGVDPNFQFDIIEYANNEYVQLFSLTSDDFFLQAHACKNLPKFDIIYIDGLHHFEQVLRDFNNTLSFAHDRTIWIIDDTFPWDPCSAYKNLHKSLNFRNLFGIGSPAWHGDVYKFVFAMHDFYPGFSYATVVNAGNPQTIIWTPPPAYVEKPLFNNFTAIESLSFFDLLDNYDILHPIQDEDLLSLVGQPFAYSYYAKKPSLEQLCAYLKNCAL